MEKHCEPLIVETDSGTIEVVVIEEAEPLPPGTLGIVREPFRPVDNHPKFRITMAVAD